jgi:hypothetical protein
MYENAEEHTDLSDYFGRRQEKHPETTATLDTKKRHHRMENEAKGQYR